MLTLLCKRLQESLRPRHRRRGFLRWRSKLWIIIPCVWTNYDPDILLCPIIELLHGAKVKRQGHGLSWDNGTGGCNQGKAYHQGAYQECLHVGLLLWLGMDLFLCRGQACPEQTGEPVVSWREPLHEGGSPEAVEVFLLCWPSLFGFLKGADVNVPAVPLVKRLRLNQ